MKKIMIIGCSGSGKSTLSNQLHRILGIEHIALDFYFLKPGWVETPKEEWVRIVEDLTDKTEWILDGNYGGTMDIRLKKADTVIFLDFSTWLCFFRVIKRILNHYKKTRPGMPEGCRERFDLEFLLYVLNFRSTRRKSILAKLSKVEKSKLIYILKNKKQVNHFLASL